MPGADHLWVADTSALSEVRRIERVGRAGEKAVLDRLGESVENDMLFYPRQVIDELGERGGTREPFAPHLWAKKHRKKATRHGALVDVVQVVMANSQVARVVDHSKAQGVDEADPYVLALAVKPKDAGHEVTVLTEDRRDRPGKLSITTACGILRVYCLPMDPFLVQQGLLI